MPATDLKHLSPLQRREHKMLTSLFLKARDRETLAREKHEAATIEREGYQSKLLDELRALDRKSAAAGGDR